MTAGLVEIMAAYRRVYDSRHLQADCQEPGLAPEPYTLGILVWATFLLPVGLSSLLLTAKYLVRWRSNLHRYQDPFQCGSGVRKLVDGQHDGVVGEQGTAAVCVAYRVTFERALEHLDK